MSNNSIDIIFATKNEGKMKEIRAIMADSPFRVSSMAEAGINIDVVEDGASFCENAIKKASEICVKTNTIVLADDSGLEIDYLDKQPGVHSARFLGEGVPYDIKNKHILELLNGVPMEKRTARFVCVIAAAIPSDEPVINFTSRGTFEGVIGFESRGGNGFGYDPIFFVPEYNMSAAEMPAELKNNISHRGKALRRMKELLAGRY